MSTENNGPQEGGDATDVVYEIWRQDDNGNKFLMLQASSEAEADRIVRSFGAKGHKQLYWYESKAIHQDSE